VNAALRVLSDKLGVHTRAQAVRVVPE
jgi:hypothetical protein